MTPDTPEIAEQRKLYEAFVVDRADYQRGDLSRLPDGNYALFRVQGAWSSMSPALSAVGIAPRTAGRHQQERADMSEPELAVESAITRSSYTIAAQFTFFRRKRGYTQKQLGKLVGVSQSEIARLETTPDIGWTWATAAALAHALDVRMRADLIPNGAGKSWSEQT